MIEMAETDSKWTICSYNMLIDSAMKTIWQKLFHWPVSLSQTQMEAE